MKPSRLPARLLICVTALWLTACDKEPPAPSGGTDPDFPAIESADSWWPVQRAPASVSIMSDNGSTAERMLSQSVTGVMAQCVNRGIGDEMVWIASQNPLHRRAFVELQQRLNLRNKGTAGVWELVRRFAREGKIKGYVLYDLPAQACGGNPAARTNESANTATMLAGLHRAVLIDRSLEGEAVACGLKMVADARKITAEECFAQNKSRLNNRFTFMADPANPAGRDLVIAQCATMVHLPSEPLTEQIVRWLAPLAPVIGVTCADEAQTVMLSSRYGHFHIGLDHTENFTLLSAAAESATLKKMQPFDPRSVDLTSEESYHAVFVSDGDNLGWIHDYLSGDERAWLNPEAGRTPLSWTFATVNMAAASPFGWNYFVDTRNPHSTLIEYGQYAYPDLFAENLPGREASLRAFARKLGTQMQRTGANVLSFISIDSRSEQARQAYRIFAQEIEGLVGMISIQYFPYPDGKGEIDWFANKQGVDIPVLRPKYCMVGGNQGIYAAYQGTPSEIFDKVETDPNTLTCTVYHAWSTFTKLPGGALGPTADSPALGTLEAIAWASQRLSPTVHLVGCEELLWRIRMKYRPEQTRSVLNR